MACFLGHKIKTYDGDGGRKYRIIEKVPRHAKILLIAIYIIIITSFSICCIFLQKKSCIEIV